MIYVGSLMGLTRVRGLLFGLFIIAALSGAVATLQVPARAPRAEAAGDCTTDPALDSEEQAFLQLINDYRVANGRVPLTASYTLSKAAQWKSNDLGVKKYFAHDDYTGPGGTVWRTWVQRIRDCDYGYNAWLGENIAAGNSGALATFNQWKNSPGHNANMLGSNYTAIGIGRAFVSGSPYGWYWTTEFGSVSDGWPSGGTPTATTTASPTRTPTATRTPTRTPTRTSTVTPTRTATPTSGASLPGNETVVPVPTATPGGGIAGAPVAITSPAAGAVVRGRIEIRAVASGADAVTVRFWIDGAYLGSETRQPFAQRWDTRRWPNGTHRIRVEAAGPGGAAVMHEIDVVVAN
jgi:uncharacterized protein YkwD